MRDWAASERNRQFRQLLPGLSTGSLRTLEAMMQRGISFDHLAVARELMALDAERLTEALPEIPAELAPFYDAASEYGRTLNLSMHDHAAHADVRERLIADARRAHERAADARESRHTSRTRTRS